MSGRPISRRDEVLNRFTHELRARLEPHLEQLILFGSRARGDHAPDSDYDCLAVLDTVSLELKEAIHEVTGDFLYHYDKLFSVLTVSEEKYRTQAWEPLFVNIQNEGVTLWTDKSRTIP